MVVVVVDDVCGAVEGCIAFRSMEEAAERPRFCTATIFDLGFPPPLTHHPHNDVGPSFFFLFPLSKSTTPPHQ